MSKFMNYLKKFLALSFMSATAAFLMSCNSNILGIVQKVETSEYSVSEKEEASVKKVVTDFDKSKNKVYKDKSDSDNSVLYAETKEKTDTSSGECTAVVMKDGVTVKAALGASSVGGEPQDNVTKIGTSSNVTSLTLDSWDEKTKIALPSTKSADSKSENPSLQEFKAINLKKNKTNEEGAALKDKLTNIPTNFVYDAKKGELLATNKQKSPFVKDLSTGNLYASTKDTWSKLKSVIIDTSALNTGTLDISVAETTIDPQQDNISINEATSMKITYTPTNKNETYYPTISKEIILCPLSQFAEQVDKLYNANENDDTTTLCKVRLDTCVQEYNKLTDTAKTASEVSYTVSGKQGTCSPKDWLGSLSSAYVLSASVNNLCEKKYGTSTKEDENNILNSISNGTLSSEDKQYLLAMIQKNYDDIDDLYGKDIKTVISPYIDDLKKTIQDGSADGKGGSNDKGGSDSKGSGGSSSKSKGSSSGSGSSSGRSGSSASIKTGSESLLMLFSSLGLSSGVLLSLGKRKDD